MPFASSARTGMRARDPRIRACRGSNPELKTRSERYVAAELDKLSVAWKKEPDCFETGLTGYGLMFFVPDFYLPVHDIYIEVSETLNYENVKTAKIEACRQRHCITVVYLGRTELRRLEAGKLCLRQVIASASHARVTKRQLRPNRK